MTKKKGDINHDNPLKAQISRDFQSLGGSSVRGAASATARKFNLKGSGAASKVKQIDSEVAGGIASRKDRPNSILHTGRKRGFNGCVAQAIDRVFDEDETQTYREAATKLDMPLSTLYGYATKEMDYRCLDVKVRPFPSEDNRAKRVEMGKEIVSEESPVKNKFHQDEKYYIANSNRRKRKVKKSEK